MNFELLKLKRKNGFRLFIFEIKEDYFFSSRKQKNMLFFLIN